MEILAETLRYLRDNIVIRNQEAVDRINAALDAAETPVDTAL